jgi:hypothetical protein
LVSYGSSAFILLKLAFLCQIGAVWILVLILPKILMQIRIRIQGVS